MLFQIVEISLQNVEFSPFSRSFTVISFVQNYPPSKDNYQSDASRPANVKFWNGHEEMVGI